MILINDFYFVSDQHEAKTKNCVIQVPLTSTGSEVLLIMQEIHDTSQQSLFRMKPQIHPRKKCSKLCNQEKRCSERGLEDRNLKNKNFPNNIGYLNKYEVDKQKLVGSYCEQIYVYNIKSYLIKLFLKMCSLKYISNNMLRNMNVSKSVLIFLTILSFFVSSSECAEFTFIKNVYNTSIEENCLPRTYVHSNDLMGIDLKQFPDKTEVEFSIMEGDPDGFFTAEDENIGSVSVLHIRTKTGLRDVLNRERQKLYSLIIKAEVISIQQSQPITASTVVRISVTDTNDNSPLFYPEMYHIEPPEDLRINSALVTVRAQDADDGMNGHVYYYLSDPSTDMFAIHPTTGILSLTRPFHTSFSSKYFLKVFAKDRGSYHIDIANQVVSEANVEISIYQVNKNSPLISVSHLPHVVEHAHAHIYAIITVTDVDEGPSGIIDYVGVEKGDPDNIFSITSGSNANEYNLIVLKTLDRETAPYGYNLTLRASDKGTPSRHSKVELHVSIEDINDHKPEFPQATYSVSLNEEAPPNTPVLRLFATDTDEGKNGEITYNITGGNFHDDFWINSATGHIYSKSWLDAEKKSHYALTITAKDQATNAQAKFSSTTVKINLLDANDNIPNFGIADEEVYMDENEPIGSYVSRVTANDFDTSENSFISYSLANRNQVPFTIDSFDGVIRTTKVLDYETERKTYILHIRASDWGEPLRRESQTSIKVIVNDVNDNRPQFLRNSCTGWIASTTPVGSPIVSFKAVDLDTRSVVTYRIANHYEQNCWSINKRSGLLTLNCDLKTNVLRDSRSKLVIVNVTATDGQYMSEANSLALKIVDDTYDTPDELYNSLDSNQIKCKHTNVAVEHMSAEINSHKNNMDAIKYKNSDPKETKNFHSPIFSDDLSQVLNIPENSLVGSELFSVKATDQDVGYDGMVVYSISNGDVDSIFEINMYSGTVILSSSLDRERTSHYMLNITAYDLGNEHFSASINISIKVLDINDNVPKFSRISYRLYLPENTRNGTSVARISAYDPDENENSHISFEMVTSVKEFKLDPDTGILKVSASLDREKQEKFLLKIRAWDNGFPERLYSSSQIFIILSDINDCAPNFGVAEMVTLSVPEDYPVGSVVATMRATDLDLDAGGTVYHKLLYGDLGSFRIDAETGIVRILSPLNYSRQKLYNITIEAEDSGIVRLKSRAHLVIHVQDVAEKQAAVEFLHRISKGQLKENEPPGTEVMSLAIKNQDNRFVQFEIVGGDGHGFFSIDTRGGNIFCFLLLQFFFVPLIMFMFSVIIMFFFISFSNIFHTG